MLNLSNIKKDLNDYIRGIHDLSEDEKDFIIEKLLDSRDAIWKLMLEFKPHGNALIIGAEWSSVYFSLAENFNNVVVWDIDSIRLSILNFATERLNLHNISFHSQNFEDLPQMQHDYDLIVLGNSLTWLPEYFKDSPSKVQNKIMLMMRKLLKNNGQCLIQSENRFAYDKWKGGKSTFNELPFITLLPRTIANLYSKIAINKTYRMYSHSLRQISKMTRKIGFSVQETYFLYPDQKNPQQLLWRNNSVPHGKVHPIERLFCRLRIGRYFLSSITLVASYERSKNSFIQELIQDMHSKLNESMHGDIDCILFGANCFMFFLRVGDKNGAVLRIPYDTIAYQRLTNAYKAINSLKNSGGIHYPLELPELIAADSYAGQDYFLEKKVPGISAIELLNKPEKLTILIKDAAKIISEINQTCTKAVVVDDKIFETYFLHYFRAAEPYLASHRKILRKTVNYLRQMTFNRSLLFIFSHGDFNLGNILITPDSKRILGIIDWDKSEMNGLPLLDIIQLILSKYRFTRSWSIGTAVRKILLPEAFNEDDRKVIENYKHRYDICSEMYRGLLIMYWATHIFRNLVESGGRKSGNWKKENIDDVLEYIDTMVL
ncbi:MAG: hypothetical protein AMK71_00300 [Nitrospira bacterium SG8_35_4]|nr:MAG: hypothetical protein AMK71_00300 [Nitrospira bacterium SG8_35_4]